MKLLAKARQFLAGKPSSMMARGMMGGKSYVGGKWVENPYMGFTRVGRVRTIGGKKVVHRDLPDWMLMRGDLRAFGGRGRKR